jgi:hypothetical protein
MLYKELDSMLLTDPEKKMNITNVIKTGGGNKSNQTLSGE